MAGTIRMFDAVALTVDLPAKGLVRGQVATVVESLGEGVWEVEFNDEEGRAYAVAAVPEARLLVLRHRPAGAA